jgi:transposase
MDRVSSEATGVYALDLAVTFDREDDIEVAVLNPTIASRLPQTIRRSKDNAADAEVSAQ